MLEFTRINVFNTISTDVCNMRYRCLFLAQFYTITINEIAIVKEINSVLAAIEGKPTQSKD
jgi:hypothetical protein